MAGKGYTSELNRILKKAGCEVVRKGKHVIWYSPITGKRFTVPHSCKSRHTANGALKDAGLDKAF